MASVSIVPSMPLFDPDAEIGASVGPRWKVWLQDFKTFLVANDITDNKRKQALLLYQAGSRVREIFRQLSDTGAADAYQTAVTKLTAYFEPQTNRLYEVYKFRQAVQQPNETLDQFHVRLRHLAQTCEFSDFSLDFEIQLQIVIGGKSTSLRKQALKDPKYTLKDMLLDGRRAEISTFQTADIEGKQSRDNLQAIKQKKSFSKQQTSARKCRNCGGNYPHKSKPCPAKGQNCHRCGKQNHFAKFCLSKQDTRQSSFTTSKSKIHPVCKSTDSDSESSSSNYCYAIGGSSQKPLETRLKIKGQRIPFLVDTGASINIIDNATFSQLKGISLQPTNIKAYAYNSQTPVKMKGKFESLVETKKRYAVAKFYVTEDNGGCLLNASTAQDLGLISLHLNKVHPPTGNIQN
ncbi:uncharacterized protein LOC135694219 isoform X1 [Rhopilema esculentum]|uniref:uncharacterized protein LOC135694219 isoform X1 n=1 Tax=Rhopilema esculentum TaxID=499914 RepID=UPI0031E33A40